MSKPNFIRIAILGTVLLLCSWAVWAQTKAKAAIDYKGYTFLADQKTGSGNISVKNFLTLIKDSVVAKDSRDDSFYTTKTFRLRYAQRGLFEDEAGNPLITTDYSFDVCEGAVDTALYSELGRKAKPGDTVFIESVMFLNKNRKEKLFQAARPIKIVLTR